MPLQGHRARPDRYSADGERKKCTGVLHREGVWLPLARFHKLKSGKNKGKPMSECIECWRARHGRDPKMNWIQEAEWLPVLTRLIAHFGSKAEVARQMGWNKQYFSRHRQDRRIRRTHFEALERKLWEVEKGPNRVRQLSASGEAEIVDAEPLATVLKEFIAEWERERPQGYRTGAKGGFLQPNTGETVMFMGPVDWLAMKTGLHTRRVSGIVHAEFPRVPLSQADALLTAIGKQAMLLPWNEIQVKPNPQWSMETYLRYMRERGCI